VQIEHIIGEHHYRTTYTNLVSVNTDIAPQEVVRAGQPIGQAGTQSTPATRGTPGTVYAMTHFQLDDFEYYREIPNPNAVSPEPFLTADAKSFFDGLWSTAAYLHELSSPSRRTRGTSGFHVADLDEPAATDRRAFDSSGIMRRVPPPSIPSARGIGTVIEAGDVSLNSTARPYPFIDLISPTAVHIGIYDVVSNELRLLANHAWIAAAARSQRRDHLSHDQIGFQKFQRVPWVPKASFQGRFHRCVGSRCARERSAARCAGAAQGHDR
jgi:hypothetical protein